MQAGRSLARGHCPHFPGSFHAPLLLGSKVEGRGAAAVVHGASGGKDALQP